MDRTTSQLITVANRLIALFASLCFFVLIVVSGPHLVHHLADLQPGHPHPHTNKSQSPDCFVHSLMQHTPLAGDAFAPLPASLPTAEQVSYQPLVLMFASPRLAFLARSPPVIQLS
jgi:hypothetical protein